MVTITIFNIAMLLKTNYMFKVDKYPCSLYFFFETVVETLHDFLKLEDMIQTVN